MVPLLMIRFWWHLTSAEECQLITNDPGRCHLRSANANVCTVPRTSTWLGDRSFSVAGSRVWNSLPGTAWHELWQFKRLLKTTFFIYKISVDKTVCKWRETLLSNSIKAKVKFIHQGRRVKVEVTRAKTPYKRN